jgi:hypothetical protein
MQTEITQSAAADRELEQRILSSLQGQHVPSLRNVTVHAQQGHVLLRGHVTSFYAKQLSQHSARRLAGESRVVDEVRVVTPATLRDPLRLGSLAAAGALLLVVSLASGCSKSGSEVAVHPVSGQVIFNGKPAAHASVIFHPKTAAEGVPVPRAQADAQGNFSLSTYRQDDGAPLGEYAVTVEMRPLVKKDGEFQSGPNIIPKQYATPQTTKITTRVAEGTNNVPIKVVR